MELYTNPPQKKRKTDMPPQAVSLSFSPQVYLAEGGPAWGLCPREDCLNLIRRVGFLALEYLPAFFVAGRCRITPPIASYSPSADEFLVSA